MSSHTVLFLLRPVNDARPVDAETAQRIGRAVNAGLIELGDGGSVKLGFDAARDAESVRGQLEMVARVELGAHWHTRYELVTL